MKIFANKNIWKKIIIVFLLITSMSFIKPEPVHADIGGELMRPICDLLTWGCDGILNIAHHLLIGQETSLIRVDLTDSILEKAGRILFTIGTFLIVMAAAAAITAGGAILIGAVTGALSSGAAAAAGLTTAALAKGIAMTAIISNIVPILVGSTYFGVRAYGKASFESEIFLPLYSISPERIFSNTIPLFDVNFFNPSAEPFEYEWIHKTTTEEYAQQTMTANGKYTELTDEDKQLNLDFSKGANVTEQLRTELKNININKGQQIEIKAANL